MRTLGNLLWFVLAGFWLWLGWSLAGILWCITLVGIPVGVQCFKFAGLMLWPFGREIVFGGGAVSLLLNVIWLLVSGLPLAVETCVVGLVLCITVVGIPFGLQCFKFAKLALLPFGASVVHV
ncbi:MAG: YccF domain-containing protein [Ruthenibacterium sp.]